MADDEDFAPRLGRQRASRGPKARRYAGRVVAAANLARGAGPGRKGRAGFSGHRYGRGAGIGRLLSVGTSNAFFRRRRVIVKARLVRLGGKGGNRAVAHLRYLQRDGTNRAGERSALYGPGEDHADGKAFLEKGSGDRHQFRFIVAPEDGDRYEDLKPLVRRLMTQMEEDLGTRLEWVAVDHYNTGHPHSHILLRGVDQDGDNLVIARDYIGRGLRERAAELVELDLGPRSDREILVSRRSEITQDRFTSIDRSLLRIADGHVVNPVARDPLEHDLQASRLGHLVRMGLAEPLPTGRYRLDPDLESVLRTMGERGDIIRTMQREFSRLRLERSSADQLIYDPAEAGASPLIGRILMRGLADELEDRHFLLIDGVDGRTHYVRVGKGETGDWLPPSKVEGDGPQPGGAVVAIRPREAVVREVDRTIAAIAAGNGGRYDREAHRRHDPDARSDYVEAHVRRLEALARAEVAGRSSDGTWVIAPDHLKRVAAFEHRQLTAQPVMVEMLSPIDVAELATAHAATWLDRTLLDGDPPQLRNAGFGRDMADALARRRQWLVEEGLAERDGSEIGYRRDLLATLRRRELLRVAGQLSRELALPFAETAEGEKLEGIYRRRVDLISGRFAVLERSRDFALVPWRPVLERRVGRSVSGLMREDGVSWSFGRGRGGPTIS
ncbi:relaxase/mobilization nuclease RlxS [Sphingobium sp.]|uniref:relaxase/mobilization nuclease RlxS n=1 Tax=Sphingobium sp. TaxID=1912891 RepID=UPI0035C75007